MAKHTYKFCFGPWNISEGQDPYGPPVRTPQTFDWKLAALKKLGYDAMMFHDDDAVPDVSSKSDAQVRKETRELRKKLHDAGVAAELVAPRLWFDPRTIDGAYTSNDPQCRRYAIERSLRTIDIANQLGTKLIVLWLAREGSYIRESKNARQCVDYLVEAINRMLAYDKKIRISIEPKPNEPMDHAYIPTIGHALALAQLTSDPERVGCLIETAHAILAGLDPADEIDFAMSFGKLWSIHLNDQNGLKFDQDKPFGSANLRVAFNQVRALERNGYGTRGEYVAFDVHPFRPTKPEHWLAHLENSRRTFLKLVQKARTFDEKQARALIRDRNYADLDQLVIEHLLGK
ncbi:MAG TPA: TIM barrel protein [Verrucomicrobiota bacterium]|nr:TIM barrel protein [Verrucomicrobiota bacterium]HNT13608.1 TIM barrel protein [Verrucomicrobiota bacterium]